MNCIIPSYELALFALSLFDQEHVLLTTKLKSNLTKTLRAESNASFRLVTQQQGFLTVVLPFGK